MVPRNDWSKSSNSSVKESVLEAFEQELTWHSTLSTVRVNMWSTIPRIWHMCWCEGV